MRAWAAGVLVAAIAVSGLAACGDDGDSAASGSSSSTSLGNPISEEEVSKLIPSHLAVKVRGDVTIDWEEDIDLRIVVIDNDDVTPVKFVSVGVEKLQPLEGGDAYRVAFDLTGGYDGKGTYELPAIGSVGNPAEEFDPDNPDPNAAGRGLSRPYLTYSRDGLIDENPAAASTIVSYENPIKPCTLKIDADDATAGSLVCPEVADATASTISIEMRWEAKR